MAFLFNLASTILGGYAQYQQNKSINEAASKQHELNLATTRLTLNTLDQRANVVSNQINSEMLRAQIAAESAAVKAEGRNRVQAATMGTTGRRTEIAISADPWRTAGNISTEAEVEAKRQQWTLQDQVTDQSRAAVAALNNSTPVTGMSNTAAALASIVGVGNSLVKQYNQLDVYSRADITSTLRSWF